MQDSCIAVRVFSALALKHFARSPHGMSSFLLSTDVICCSLLVKPLLQPLVPEIIQGIVSSRAFCFSRASVFEADARNSERWSDRSTAKHHSHLPEGNHWDCTSHFLYSGIFEIKFNSEMHFFLSWRWSKSSLFRVGSFSSVGRFLLGAHSEIRPRSGLVGRVCGPPKPADYHVCLIDSSLIWVLERKRISLFYLFISLFYLFIYFSKQFINVCFFFSVLFWFWLKCSSLLDGVRTAPKIFTQLDAAIVRLLITFNDSVIGMPLWAIFSLDSPLTPRFL
jgi:hypothetical protein